MQPDFGGAWRQEVLRRLEEEQRTAAAARPAAPPVPRGRVAVPWFPEIELTETVKEEIVLSRELTTSGNGR